MSGQGKTADLRRTSIQHVEEHAFALLHAYRFTAAEHSPVDREGLIPDLESMRRAFSERGFHGVLAAILQFLYRRFRRQKSHRHVTSPAIPRFKSLHRQENLPLIVP